MSTKTSEARLKQLRKIELDALNTCGAFVALERAIENPEEHGTLIKLLKNLHARLEELLQTIAAPIETEPHKAPPPDERQTELLATHEPTREIVQHDERPGE